MRAICFIHRDDLNVLIIIALNSQSGNSNIPTISDLIDAYFISSNCAFCLMSSNFVLVVRKLHMMYWIKDLCGEAFSGGGRRRGSSL